MESRPQFRHLTNLEQTGFALQNLRAVEAQWKHRDESRRMPLRKAVEVGSSLLLPAGGRTLHTAGLVPQLPNVL